jgi:glycosyltransferase involved in cell wall biosynthesis
MTAVIPALAAATPAGGPQRILFVAPYPLSPIRVRPYQLLRQLVARGHSVTLVCPVPAGEGDALDEARHSGAEVVGVPLRRADSIAAYLRALPGPLPLQAAHCLSPAFVGAVRAALRRGGFDIVHIEHLRAAEVARGAAAGLPGAPPLLLDAVDSISLLFERAARCSPSPATRAMALLELARTRRYEAAYGRRFDHIAISSPEDRWALETLRRHRIEPAGAPISVVPNGVDIDYFKPTGQEREPATLLFSGKMSYHANHAAALFLLDAIMPLVWRAMPESRVVIAGARPAASLLARGRDPRITVTGYLPDLRPAMARATLALAPLRYGVGVQNKVLEAMAMGTAVVAARQATVALAAQPEVELLVADDAPGFAAQIIALLGDAQRRATVGNAGRQYVERHHSWALSAALLEGCYAAAQRSFGGSPRQRRSHRTT